MFMWDNEILEKKMILFNSQNFVLRDTASTIVINVDDMDR